MLKQCRAKLASEATIVIGSGVPSPWLDKTMNVRRVSTTLGSRDARDVPWMPLQRAITSGVFR